ncbi:polyprenol monophosphomannose synthase [Luteipulveratus halotolerans]|uniref:Dolichol-phosphate mannosyltransferase n=1 Tax=Luteipulveratus halotolerans TaxID=1631356 RepID=A0A0L6CH10_9MICO|nr:polyprenol monophosphomannose synthase [Luteipulveratus halotolerans]KNX37092.1 dolichol-phosphate mannosyltransferase [Luteipulveratus halotolerans]
MTASDGRSETARTAGPDRTPLTRVLVLIPTYNERDNLPRIVERVRAAAPEVDVLVLDDSSPDGTGEVADRLAAHDPQVTVMHRAGKEGLGAAYLAGFAEGLARGYDALVEMDADGSHPAEVLPTMLREAADADLVIGSRWIPGGSVVNWPWHREALSRGGNLYIRLLLGMPVKDATAGYRVYRSSALREIGLDEVVSAGYCFQTDLTWRAVRAGLRIVEVPIRFVEREIGDSKMDQDVVRESLVRISGWGADYRWRQLRDAVARRRP